MKYGTGHFTTLERAVVYYEAYGFNRMDVQFKLKDGEIVIGKPSVKPGQRCYADAYGRYWIEEEVDNSYCQ